MGEPETSERRLLEEVEALRRRVAELETQRATGVEAALRASELRYRVLYEENPSMYFTVDPDGVVLSVNPFGAEQLGYTVEELIGRPVLQVFHQDDQQSVARQLRGCVDNPGTPMHWEFRKIHKDGELMWVHEIVRAVTDSDGKTVVLIVCDDITERKAVEQELRDSRERYRSLYTKTPVMLHSIDQDHRLVEVSEHWLHVLGYDRHEVIGRTITDFMTPDSKRYALQVALPEFYRSGIVRDIPYQLVKKDGEIIDILLSAIVERDRHGRFVRSLTVLIDVTEHNKAQEALQRTHGDMERRVIERTAELERQRRFLRQIIDVDPNFIFAKDREGRFTLVNQATADAYGTNVDGLIGRSDADFNPNEEEVEYFRRVDLEVMQTRKERFIPEEPITDASGHVRWLQTVKRPLVDENGKCTQVLGSATDITGRKEAEQRLRQSEAALRLSQKELQRLAGRLLTAQEDERRRLAREMHDDLTQRLAALALQVGRLERLLDSPSVEAKELLSQVLSGLRQLSSDVHALSRRLHPSILDDLGLVDAIAAECEGFAQREGIAADFDCEEVPEDLSNIQALCLYRITQEALRNVAKHAGTAAARVAISRENGRLTLVVEDRGVGFEKSRGHAGEGLGLASMEERARLIGATFSVESGRGEGTRIRVTLPEQGSEGDA